MGCRRKFEQHGTTHVHCKAHAPCNVEGQYSVRRRGISQALSEVYRSKNPSMVHHLVFSQRKRWERASLSDVDFHRGVPTFRVLFLDILSDQAHRDETRRWTTEGSFER